MVSTWQAVRATAAERKVTTERDEKEVARRQARLALNKLTDETVERLMARQPRLTRQDREFLRQVLALHEEFAGAQGDSPESRAGVADARFRVGMIRSKLGEYKEAEEAYRAAADIQQELVAGFPDRPEYHHDLAMSHTNLGNLLLVTGRSGPAEEAHRTAVGLLQKLADDSPGRPEYLRDLATGHSNLGRALMARSRFEQAEQAWRTSVDLMRKLVANSAEPANRSLLASCYQNLGNLLLSTKHPREAEECFRAGLDLFRVLADEISDRPEYRSGMAKAHNSLGALLDKTGRRNKAEEAFRAAVEAHRKLAADFPGQPEYRSLLAQSHHNLGEFLRDAGPPQRAEVAYRAARDVFVRLVADYSEVPDYQNGLAVTLGKLALLKRAGRDLPAARQFLEDARPHHQAALRAEPKNPAYLQAYRVHLATSAETCFGLGDHRKAADATEELARLPSDPAKDAYNSARLVSQCVPLAEKDGQLTEAKRKELVRAYGDRAITLLRSAIQHGYKDGGRMKKDPALNPLRTRDEFRQLLRELDAAAGRP